MGKMKTTFVGEDENKNEKKHDQAHKGEAENVHLSGLKGGQRVKMVEVEEPVLQEKSEENQGKTAQGRKIVERVRGKKYVSAKAKFDHEKHYKVADAVKFVKESSYSKFDGTIELHIVVKKTGTSVSVSLPHQAGREKKVEIASDETIEKLKTGKIDFDILVATAEMMPKLVPFARLLGPKGLMPNPKNGTLVTDPTKAKSFSAATVTIKTEKDAPLIHTVAGKVSQKDEETIANIEAIMKALGGSKQIVRAYTKATMGPAVKIEIK
jgi:large subunit ribosomal protein L1